MNNYPKIAICIPTIHRDNILMETLNSILDVWSDDWKIYIIDQNKIEDYSTEKEIFYKTACSKFHTETDQQIKVIEAPYDCGLSFSRNLGVAQAAKDNIPFCLMSADSIKFDKSMKHINNLIKYINYSSDFNIDLLGLNLKNRTVGWEAKLDLKDSFILDFIDKNNKPDWKFADLETIRDSKEWSDENGNPAKVGDVINIWKCDIVRNFFLATTKSLLKVQWDENLKMHEHESFFWEYKKAGYKVGWTNSCHGEYIGTKENEYGKLRAKNMRESLNYLFKKYNLTSWAKYINLERARNQAD